jgi:hypothetical protein
MTRWAYTYVRILFVLAILLFTGSFLLHVGLIAGWKEASPEYGLFLFYGAIIIGVATTLFVKDRRKWIVQIKSCPEWMWRGALIVGAYGLLVVCFQAIFPAGRSISGEAMIVSGFPLGFDAVNICVLYSVLWAAYLDQSEVIERVRNSIIVFTLGAAVFLAYRAGYFPHPNTHKGVD